MSKTVVILCWMVLTLTLKPALADVAPLKVVMQINSQNMAVILRALRDGLEVIDQARAAGSKIDLKVVVYGSALDLFEKGTDSRLITAFQKISAREEVHFFAAAPTLKRTGKGAKDLLRGFSVVASGAYEVLNYLFRIACSLRHSFASRA